MPLALPALARAAKLGKRAGRVGFDWPDAGGVREKIEEELREVAQAPAAQRPEEIGDLLFAVANWSRHFSIDPEEALRLANAKFEKRFRAMEELARQRSLTLGSLDAAAWDALWNEVKKQRKRQRIQRSVGIHRHLHRVSPRSGIGPADGGSMSISNNKVLVSLVVAGFTLASATAGAQDHYPNGYFKLRRRPLRRLGGHLRLRQGGRRAAADHAGASQHSAARMLGRDALRTARYGEGMPRKVAGGTLLGAVLGAAIGNQIGSGDGRKVATAGGAVIGAAIGHQQAVRRSGYTPPPPREYTVQRCDTRYHDEWQERVDGYRVTYQYHGRRQVTEMPYRPGDRIRVRVDVSPAES